MEAYVRGIKGISGFMNAVAAICLTFIMLLTTLDVILRMFKTPIVGTYELVGFMGGVIIGFAIPMTSWVRGHIYVDFVIQKLPPGGRKAAHTVTRLMVIAFFVVAGLNLIKQGVYLYRTREVSPTLQLPFYPVVFGIGFACVVECLVLIADIVKISGGKYE
ncbi:MAG: Tripartite ATP-independent periplasmic transporter [Syntrophorhabdaceae bacterium PtaU1.Bin034]|jgi:TRAP-type C4-dicarboxylate transport system permease small subunit|nr:MAG: Tripartite ATP-independent periplasmic transporter [Syntrophorhabdaceae bacterium PtaU1.Bin034]